GREDKPMLEYGPNRTEQDPGQSMHTSTYGLRRPLPALRQALQEQILRCRQWGGSSCAAPRSSPTLRRPHTGGSMRVVPLLFAAGLILGCADVKELMSLDLGLIAEFHEQGINVNVYNGHSLTVSFA